MSISDDNFSLFFIGHKITSTDKARPYPKIGILFGGFYMDESLFMIKDNSSSKEEQMLSFPLRDKYNSLDDSALMHGIPALLLFVH